MTCWLSDPPGSCSMLITLSFDALAWAISPTRTLPGRPRDLTDSTIALSLTLTDVFRPEQLVELLLQVRHPGLDHKVVLSTGVVPTIRLMVPAALPSIRFSGARPPWRPRPPGSSQRYA